MEKWTQEQYATRLQEMKQEAKNLATCCKAMLDAMLEGDGFIVEPKIRTKVAGTLTVRYYVDNLHPGRRKYADVMKEQQQ